MYASVDLLKTRMQQGDGFRTQRHAPLGRFCSILSFFSQECSTNSGHNAGNNTVGRAAWLVEGNGPVVNQVSSRIALTKPQRLNV